MQDEPNVPPTVLRARRNLKVLLGALGAALLCLTALLANYLLTHPPTA